MIIDEVQKLPNLVSYIQGVVDLSKLNGQFILTGSQQFELGMSVSQSLAGRTAIIKLLPFSMSELPTPLPALSQLIYRGFYPKIVCTPKINPTQALSFYTNTYLERDLRDLKQVKNLRQFEIFLKLCASNIGQVLNKNRLASDVGVNNKTVDSWLSLLQTSFVIFLLQPYFTNTRKRLVKSPKIYFYDTGLAAYLLGVKNESHIDSHPLKGNLFENLVVIEKLKEKFNLVESPELYYYRDSSGNEVDLIEVSGEETYSYEIKLSQTLSQNLFKGLDFYKKIDSKNRSSTLVYSGKREQTRYNHRCLPYTKVCN